VESLRNPNEPPPLSHGTTQRHPAASAAQWAVLAGVIATSLIVHAIAASGFFRGDDFIHLYQIENHGYVEFALTPHGGHLMMTRNSLLYLAKQLFGLHAQAYYLVILASHALNVGLLFRLARKWSVSLPIAALAALVWGASPLQQGTLGWISAYGHVLCVSFLLLFLLDVQRIAERGTQPSALRLAGWWALQLMAATSFGTGIPLAMLSGVVAWLLIPDRAVRRRSARALAPLALAIPLLYYVSHVVYGRWFVDPVGLSLFALQTGSLQLSQLLASLTLFAELAVYGLASLLFGPLFDYGPHGIIAGPWRGASASDAVSASLIIAAIVAIVVAPTLQRIDLAARRRVLAMTVVAFGCYAILAVGRAFYASVAGTSLPGMAVEPRYHYAGSAALVLGLAVLAAARPLVHPAPPALRAPRRLAILGVALLSAAWLTGAFHASRVLYLALPTPGARGEWVRVVERIQGAIVAAPPGSAVEIRNHDFHGAGAHWQHKLLFPGWAGVFVVAFPENVVEGRRVYFRETSEGVARAARSRASTRIAEIVIGPGDPVP